MVSALGAGGMGEVYRAKDTRLNRDVAIKVLPASFADDADRLARFTREAQTLAAVNHPNIAAIYAVEGAALVMELVDGETLEEKIRHGGLALDEALHIARQIAEALEAAHDLGIVHRDLKPANVKVRADGTVKVLDFGLAKAMDTGGAKGPGSASMSPTLSIHATQAGMILGTAAYMAPEQARGKAVDRRADIWAFGAVLYEMLTGRRAFEGDEVTDVLAAVLRQDIDWAKLPAATPPRLRRLLERCLDRDPKQRLRDIGEARVEIAKIEAGAPDASVMLPASTLAAPASTSRLLPWALAAAVLTIGALAIPAVRHVRETPRLPDQIVTLTMDVSPAERLGRTVFFGRPGRTAFAIAPDGATVVFVGETGPVAGVKSRMLYRRPLAEARAVAIPGTEGADYPFFAPNGEWVGFAAGNKVKKVALSGGPPIDVCTFPIAGRIEGASWGPGGVIAFARQGLWTVPESGGTPAALLEADADAERGSPIVLPDGQTVLFTQHTGYRWEDAHIDAINVISKQRKTVLANAADARYSPTGHLVFIRSAALLAVPFDAARVEVTGAPVALIAGVMQSTNALNTDEETGMGQFALSASGMLMYAAGDRNPTITSTLVTVDRKGAESKLADVKGMLVGIRASPSGSRVVAFKAGDGSAASDIWMYDLPSGAGTRLTSSGAASWPLFAPDGKSLMFLDARKEPGIYTLPLDNSAGATRLVEQTPALAPASWSSDGKWLAYVQNVGNVQQIFVRPLRDGKLVDGPPRQFSPSTFEQSGAAFSPDGRSLAYESDESGSHEVYLQPFPGPGERRRVSYKGGTSPVWSSSGRELFYLAQRTRDAYAVMTVDVSASGGPSSNAPRQLFEGPYANTTPLRSYDVTADGRFIMSRDQMPPDEPVTKLTVVLGWAQELKRRVAGK